MPQVLKPVNLMQDLSIGGRACIGRVIVSVFVQTHSDTPLVDNALVLFLEFQKYRLVDAGWDTIAAQPQFFLIDRFFRDARIRE